ncbi:hypothetical protein Tco_1031204 [Tanacetum coccineum]|uniref:Uncharacterized protein n=1 Tax=Tanacetum coccineum TaxID=301880 RepID=A0ABQ5GA19_9ASTR
MEWFMVQEQRALLLPMHIHGSQRGDGTLDKPITRNMAPLPARDQRHPWLRYEGQEYTDAIIHDYEDRISDTVLDLDTDDTLCFQLGRLRRQMSWRQFIIAMGLHTVKEIETNGPSPLLNFYTSIRDPLRRLYHRLIAFNISGRGQAPEKVITTNLFYLRSMDEGTEVNVPYLLAQYLFRYVEGRKQGARMSGGQFISRLIEHFGLVTKERLRGLVCDLKMIDMDELARLHICERIEDTWADPAPVQEPQARAATPATRTMPQRMARLEEEVRYMDGWSSIAATVCEWDDLYELCYAKRHAFWSLNEEISRYYSDNLYAVSIKEDTAYPCLHFTRNHEDLKPYMPYPGDSIRRIEDYLKILEDIERGPYFKKPPIRRIDLNQYGVSTNFQTL